MDNTKIRDWLINILATVLVVLFFNAGIKITSDTVTTFFYFLIAGFILTLISRFAENQVKEIAKHQAVDFQIIVYLILLFLIAAYVSSNPAL